MALGTQEIWILVLVVLLLFGAAAIPKLARSLGRAQGEFTKARKEFDTELKKAKTETEEGGDEEERIRSAARELGIEEQGRDLAEVKRLLNERLA